MICYREALAPLRKVLERSPDPHLSRYLEAVESLAKREE